MVMVVNSLLAIQHTEGQSLARSFI